MGLIYGIVHLAPHASHGDGSYLAARARRAHGRAGEAGWSGSAVCGAHHGLTRPNSFGGDGGTLTGDMANDPPSPGSAAARQPRPYGAPCYLMPIPNPAVVVYVAVPSRDSHIENCPVPTFSDARESISTLASTFHS